jgi:hypothetical protein
MPDLLQDTHQYTAPKHAEWPVFLLATLSMGLALPKTVSAVRVRLTEPI